MKGVEKEYFLQMFQNKEAFEDSTIPPIKISKLEEVVFKAPLSVP